MTTANPFVRNHLNTLTTSALVVGGTALLALVIGSYFTSAPQGFWIFALFVFPLPFVGWYAVWRTLRAAYSAFALLVLWATTPRTRPAKQGRVMPVAQALAAPAVDFETAQRAASEEHRKAVLRRLFAQERAVQVLPKVAQSQVEDAQDCEGEEWKMYSWTNNDDPNEEVVPSEYDLARQFSMPAKQPRKG